MKLFLKLTLLLCVFYVLPSLLSKPINAFESVSDQLVFNPLQYTYDDYTESDYLLNFPAYTIRDYEEDLFKSGLDYNNGYFADEIIVSSDDPVVGIIPRELFINSGNHVFIGEEYGFFVNTIENYLYNLSTVLVFDIVIDYDTVNPLNPSNYSIELRPIFQYQYMYFYGSSYDIQIYHEPTNYTVKVINQTGNSDFVIAYPSVTVEEFNVDELYYSYTFNKVFSYYLEDIIIASELENENELNYGDFGYQPTLDNGLFFIEVETTFSGVGDYDLTSAGNLFLSVLGFTKIGGILSVINLFTSGYDFFVDSSHGFRSKIETGSTLLSSSYSDKDLQINENGNLNKYASSAVVSDEEGRLMFGTNYANSYYKASFEVGGQTNYQFETRITSAISLNITNGWGTECAHYERVYVTQNGDKIPEVIELENIEYGYVLRDGYMLFSYTPNFSGEYIFENDRQDLVVTLIDANTGDILYVSDEYMMVYLLQYNEYYFKIETLNDNTASFTCYFSVKEYTPNTSFYVNSYSSIILKYTSTSIQFVNLIVNYSNLDIRLYDDNFQLISNNQTNSLSTQLSSDVYYIVIINSSYSSYYASVSISEPSSLSVNSEYTMYYQTGDYFRRFTAPYTGQYTIVVSSQTLLELSIYKKNSTQLPSYITTTGNEFKAYTITLSYGDILYIGYHNSLVSNVSYKLSVKYNQDLFQWYSNNQRITDGLPIFQGQSVNVTLKVAGMLVSSNNFYLPSAQGITLNGNTLSASITAVPTIVSGVKPNIVVYHDGELSIMQIYILQDIEVLLSQPNHNNDTYSSNARIQWEVYTGIPTDQFILHIRYTFSDNTTYPDLVTGKGKFGYVYIPQEYLTSSDRTIASIQVVSMDYYHNGGIVPISIANAAMATVDSLEERYYSEEMQINTMFQYGDGTVSNPYVIESPRHLYNIRYLTKWYYDYSTSTSYEYIDDHFIIGGNLLLSSTWTPIDAEFQGSISGYNNTNQELSNLLITETKSYKNIGLFRKIGNAEISNITISGTINISDSSSTTYIGIGMLAGYASNSLISNVSINGTITSGSKYTYTGGIIGRAYTLTSISYSYNRATVTSAGHVGGIVGYLGSSTISNSTNYGSVRLTNNYLVNLTSTSQNRSAGEIVGYMSSGTVSINYAYGSVNYVATNKNTDTLLDPRIGSIVGEKLSGTVSTNYTTGIMDVSKLNTFYTGIWPFRTYHTQKDYIGGQIGKS